MSSSLQLIRRAKEICESDLGTVLCWLINQEPPYTRVELYHDVCDTLRDLRLMDIITEEDELCLPELFTHKMAMEIWGNLSSIVNDIDNYKVVTEFLKPCDSRYFEPYVFPGRWTPEEWQRPISPSKVRQNLGLNEVDIINLKDIAKGFIERLSTNHTGIPPKLVDNSYSAPKLTLGVSSYSDCLALHTLIYAISDDDEIKDSIEFIAASFYDEKDQSGKSIIITENRYNCGYATESQIKIMKEYSSHGSIISTYAYDESFARSILVETNYDMSTFTVYNHLSFIGPLLPIQPGTIVNSKDMDITIDRNVKTISIAEKVNNIVEWETALLMNFFGTSYYRHNKTASHNYNYAISLSTDAHIWATHYKLFLPKYILAQGAIEPIEEKSSNIRHLSWEEVGTSARLCWFIRTHGKAINEDDSHNVVKLNHLIARYITKPINNAWNEVENGTHMTNELKNIRETLKPLAQALLAPLLTAYPNYNGPLLWLPPEALLSKVRSEDGHIRYEPIWWRNMQSPMDPVDPKKVTKMDQAQRKRA